jgi:hypothetical protein
MGNQPSSGSLAIEESAQAQEKVNYDDWCSFAIRSGSD